MKKIENPKNYTFDGDGKQTNSKAIKRAVVTVKAAKGEPLYHEIHLYKNLDEIKKLLAPKFPKGTIVFLIRGDYYKTVSL